MKNKEVLAYIKNNPAKSKFEKLLNTLLLADEATKYSWEVMDRCYDMAVKQGHCEICKKKGEAIYNNGLYCKKHYEEQIA